MCNIRPSHILYSAVLWNKNGYFTLGHFKVIIVVTLKIRSFMLKVEIKKYTSNRFFPAITVELKNIYMTHNISMTALVLHITTVAYLFCAWFALSTQMPLLLALMISKVYLTDKGQECSMAWKSVKPNILNGKLAPGSLNTNRGPGIRGPSNLHYYSFIRSTNLPDQLSPLC